MTRSTAGCPLDLLAAACPLGPYPAGCSNDADCPEDHECGPANECLSSGCDCADRDWLYLPDCGGGVCTPVGNNACEGPNPEGCVQNDCPEGLECQIVEGECVATCCECDEDSGGWACTEDCGGGSCVDPEPDACEGPNPAGCRMNGCPEGMACEQVPGECVPSSCRCDPESGFWACTRDCGGGSCVPANGAESQYYETCGDPVCGGHRENPDVPPCEAQEAGQACNAEGALCDLVNGCNSHLVCADSDPRQQPGGCPRSSRDVKTDIRHLSKAERDRLAERALKTRSPRAPEPTSARARKRIGTSKNLGLTQLDIIPIVRHYPTSHSKGYIVAPSGATPGDAGQGSAVDSDDAGSRRASTGAADSTWATRATRRRRGRDNADDWW